MKSLRPVGWLALLAIAAMIAAACGGDNKTSGAATTTAASATTAGAVTTAGSSAGGSSATTAAASDTAAWDAIVAKAKQEGKVTIYSSQGLDVLNDLAAKFKDKYGITLEVVRGIDSELIPKVDAENQTGKNVADVFAFASAQWGVDNAAKGMFVAPAGPAFDDPAYNKASNVSADGTQFVSTAAVFGYAWNTDRYSNGMKGYADALDPALAGGKVGVIDVHTSTVLVDFYQYLEAQMGPDYLTKLAAQKPKIYPSGLPMAQVGVGAAGHHRSGHHRGQGGQAGPDEVDAGRSGRVPGEMGRDVQVVGGSGWVIPFHETEVTLCPT
jgi:iron(III) transport system substrate-binding protein